MKYQKLINPASFPRSWYQRKDPEEIPGGDQYWEERALKEVNAVIEANHEQAVALVRSGQSKYCRQGGRNANGAGGGSGVVHGMGVVQGSEGAAEDSGENRNLEGPG